MRRKIVVGAVAGALMAASAGAAVANPYGRGPGPGPGASGDHALYGLCMAYAHNANQAKERSPIFNQYTPEEWEDICQDVRPGGSRGGSGGGGGQGRGGRP
jgi:hypothetical protein